MNKTLGDVKQAENGECGGAEGGNGTENGTVSAEERIRELEALVYVPGVTKCAKCGFSQISTVLAVNSGRMAADNRPCNCPNGCGPLRRVTEREAGNELCDRLDAALDRERAHLRAAEGRHRWNISLDDGKVLEFCRGNHDRAGPCQPERYLSEAEVTRRFENALQALKVSG